MDNATDNACVLLATVAQHPLSIPLCVVNVLLLLGAFIGGINLLIAVRRSTTVPFNVSIVLQIHTGACIWLSATWIYRASLAIIRYVKYDTSNACMLSAWDCVIKTTMAFIPVTVCDFAPLALGIERAVVTRRLTYGRVRLFPTRASVRWIKVVSNDTRRAPLIVLSLLLPCAVVILSTLTPVYQDAISGASGRIFCTTIVGTLSSLLRTLLLAVIIEIASFVLFLYVYFTNRRLRLQFHIHNADQTLPIRVSLRRNIDVAGALIVSNLLHAFCYGTMHILFFVVYFLNAPRIPPVTLAIYSDMLPRLLMSVHMFFHPWILIGMMPALRDSRFIVSALKRMCKSTKVKPKENIDFGGLYFSQLQRQWE